MIKFIAVVGVVWFLFYVGIAQLLLIWTAVLGTTIFG
jgi:hypothetical protein